ncbi:hypothetical protein CVT26_002011 [Gymnopilus dilepis]|uniref:Uncharacterized protein n=1 Tax=Gymnopilus dilepis TaxID=231916 RepID=A0A409YX87_9AGAR|nr:hypothetical protein CVT26_002011 [Gymnopilus dilepis]
MAQSNKIVTIRTSIASTYREKISEDLGDVVIGGNGAGNIDVDIEYLGTRTRDTEDVAYETMKIPFQNAAVYGTNIIYAIYYSVNVPPSADIGNVGDIFIWKGGLLGPSVYWKKLKENGQVAWKLKRKSGVVRYPQDSRLTLQAGPSGPEWQFPHGILETDGDFAKAASSFMDRMPMQKAVHKPVDNVTYY